MDVIKFWKIILLSHKKCHEILTTKGIANSEKEIEISHSGFEISLVAIPVYHIIAFNNSQETKRQKNLQYHRYFQRAKVFGYRKVACGRFRQPGTGSEQANIFFTGT